MVGVAAEVGDEVGQRDVVALLEREAVVREGGELPGGGEGESSARRQARRSAFKVRQRPRRGQAGASLRRDELGVLVPAVPTAGDVGGCSARHQPSPTASSLRTSRDGPEGAADLVLGLEQDRAHAVLLERLKGDEAGRSACVVRCPSATPGWGGGSAPWARLCGIELVESTGRRTSDDGDLEARLWAAVGHGQGSVRVCVCRGRGGGTSEERLLGRRRRRRLSPTDPNDDDQTAISPPTPDPDPPCRRPAPPIA